MSLILLMIGVAIFARAHKPGLFLIGLIWGFFFNPPVIFRGEDFLRVKRLGALLPTTPYFVLSTQDGREFQAKGRGQVGDEGKARCFRRSAWFFEGCRFRSAFPSDATKHHPFSLGAFYLKEVLWKKLDELDAFERSWLKALILGDETDLAPALREDFKRAGLYHLLVVSGFHFTVLCRLLEVMVRGPFQFGYVVGILRARPWVRLGCALRLVIVLGAFLYGLLVGFQTPCQRALLGFAVQMLEPLFHGRATLWKRLQWTAILQTVFFPTGFASVSNFLSWGAYVFVVAAFMGALPFFQKLVGIVVLQLKLLVLSFALIGKVSLVGIVTNALVAPGFPLVFLGGLLRLLQGDTEWTSFIAWSEAMFVRLVRFIAVSTTNGLLTASPRQQWFLLLPSVLLFWQALRRIQNPLEGRGRGCYPRGRAITKGRLYGKTLGRQKHPHRG